MANMEFRLIVDSPDDSEPGSSIQVNGQEWHLTKPLPLDLEHPLSTKYTCISYVWGPAREAHPFHRGEVMSPNTIPALSAAMRHSTNRAFWIDALCVPSVLPLKHYTLGSMGYIYSAASEVIIALPPTLFPVLNEMEASDRLSEAVLLRLEKDEWVRSVWTYQEVVNSKAVYFVGGAVKTDASHFLNCLGHSLRLYGAAHRLSALDVSQRLPRLNALEELLVDWMMGGYAERSALQAMSQFQYRHNHDPRNYFYAVVGAMIKGPWSWNVEMTIEHLADEFMDVCEAKNDYSFIYSANPRHRADSRGRYWRPAAGLLQAVLAWHSWGRGQRGRYDEDGFWLEKLVSLRPSDGLGIKGSVFLGQWLRATHSDELIRSNNDIAEQVLTDLKKMAYTGSDQFLWTTYGIFFPQTALPDDAGVEILVATEVRLAFGAAALARVTRGEQIEFVPGVFVGEVLEALASDVLLGRTVPDDAG